MKFEEKIEKKEKMKSEFERGFEKAECLYREIIVFLKMRLEKLEKCEEELIKVKEELVIARGY